MMSANAFPFSYSALSFALVKEGGERGQTLMPISTTIQIKAALFSALSMLLTYKDSLVSVAFYRNHYRRVF